jgi:hypothetical protein
MRKTLERQNNLVELRISPPSPIPTPLKSMGVKGGGTVFSKYSTKLDKHCHISPNRSKFYNCETKTVCFVLSGCCYNREQVAWEKCNFFLFLIPTAKAVQKKLLRTYKSWRSV